MPPMMSVTATGGVFTACKVGRWCALTNRGTVMTVAFATCGKGDAGSVRLAEAYTAILHGAPKRS